MGIIAVARLWVGALLLYLFQQRLILKRVADKILCIGFSLVVICQN